MALEGDAGAVLRRLLAELPGIPDGGLRRAAVAARIATDKAATARWITDADLAVNISDLLISPVWIAGGLLLWRRKAYGFVTGLGLLLGLTRWRSFP